MDVLNLFHSCVCSFTAGAKSLCKLSERSVGAHTYFLNLNRLHFLMIPSCPFIMTSQFHCPRMCCSLSNAWVLALAREVSSTRTLFRVTTGTSWMNRLLPCAIDHQWVWGKGSSFAAGQWVTVLKVHFAINCLRPLSALTDWTWTCWEEGIRLNLAAQEIHGSDPVKYKRERDRNG